MKYLLTALALAMVADGLWSHDWRLILASAATALIWPLISSDLEAEVEHEALLDRLWDDEASA